MISHSKYRKYFLISLILISIGIIILTNFAIPPAYNAYTFSIDQERCYIYVRCVLLDFDYQQPLSTDEAINFKADMMFKSTFVFAEDIPIRYDFKFNSTTPELIESINIIIVSKYDNFTNVYSKNPQEILDDAREHNKLIEVTKQSENTFARKAQWTLPTEQEIKLVGIVVNKYHKASFIPQIDTSIQLKGIDAYFTVQETVNSERNNLIMLGLTWASISAIFILIGVDVLLRIHLRESEVNEWFSNEQKIYR